MKKIIIAISMMLAMNIFLAVPALAENYQEYGLYDSDGNYKGMFYSIEDYLCFLHPFSIRNLHNLFGHCNKRNILYAGIHVSYYYLSTNSNPPL